MATTIDYTKSQCMSFKGDPGKRCPDYDYCFDGCRDDGDGAPDRLCKNECDCDEGRIYNNGDRKNQWVWCDKCEEGKER